MRNILLLIFLAFATTGFSQLVMEADYSVDGLSTDTTVDITFTVTNTGATAASFYWATERSNSMPRDWQFTVCDAVICYAEGTESSICNDPQYINFIPAGASITYYKVGLHPNNVAGDHTLDFVLTDICGGYTSENVLASTTMTFNVEAGVSSLDSEIQSLSDQILIYPNPTTDRFQVKNDSGIASISIFNIVGKQILSSTHKTGQLHDVSDLDKGIYLVRMLDKTNNSLRVIRLTKD